MGLKDVYRLNCEAFLPLDAGGPLIVALEGGEIRAATPFNTSPAMPAKDFVVLEDDRHLQASENVVPVVRREVLSVYGSELERGVNSVTARHSTATLQMQNRRVKEGGDDPIEVARDWLGQEGLHR